MTPLERLKKVADDNAVRGGWGIVMAADLALALAVIEAAQKFGTVQYSGLDDALEALTESTNGQ